MGVTRIHILPSDLANQIAAGEVVERPASVIKELVENSIDAGARRISVAVEFGGKRRIRVEDDGEGMGPEDVRLAVERHATSKVRRSEDLEGIATLGFRGEALPSIAAVSKLSLASKQVSRDGGRLSVHAGTIVQKEPAGLPVGTTVVVVTHELESIFFHNGFFLN